MSNEHSRDAHYKMAKREGYRARSAYKLLEIQKRFNIFKRAFYILDLGSAPGSWLQVAKKFATENLEKYNDDSYYRDHFKIMGVDIKKLVPIEDIKIIKMDFTNPDFSKELDSYFQGEKLDLIISDASIKKSGVKFSDQVKQYNLCYNILEFSKYLKKKGNIVIKVFQGADFNKFYTKLKQQFGFLKSYKPKSSKKKSNEIYIIGLKKLF
ncbi:MAG: SAM-dependent methyltransferase [Candidatus Hodarchaeota archaeon]